jgi:Cu+-exporting ATPase
VVVAAVYKGWPYMLILRYATVGVVAASILLLVFVGIVSLVSGSEGLRQQWIQYWPYILALASGFGIQVTLYLYLRHIVANGSSGGVVAVSGATSTGAMISCCAHYLANILPLIGATGIVALIGQYQVELFWVGLAFNAIGIGYITKKISITKKRPYET